MNYFKLLKVQEDLIVASAAMIYDLHVSDATVLNEITTEQSVIAAACFKLFGLEGDSETMDDYTLFQAIATYVEENGLICDIRFAK